MAVTNLEEEEYQQTHLDKIVGIFTEPIVTFGKISKFPLKTSDWIIPLLLVILTSSMSVVVMLSSSKIKFQVIEERAGRVQEEVYNGNLTQEEADEKIEKIRDFLEGSYGTFAPLTGIVVGGFAFFLVTAAVFFLLSKYLLKGNGSYQSALIACGLPQYILILQVIITVILSLSLGRFLDGLSLAVLLNIDKSSLEYVFLSKIDLFLIWFYLTLSFGLAKLFRSSNIGKYVALVFGAWIVFGVIWHFATKAIPFLS